MNHAAAPSLFIVTGSSRGLGRALVELLLAPQHHVLGIARGAVALVLAAQTVWLRLRPQPRPAVG